MKLFYNICITADTFGIPRNSSTPEIINIIIDENCEHEDQSKIYSLKIFVITIILFNKS